jgi:2-iminobutanoate/2-iminopropanoate deaminase
MKQIIDTKKAPAAIGPYSQAVVYNDIIYTSGQIAINPETGKLLEGAFSDRVKQVFSNLSAILDASGSRFENVLKVTIYLTDLSKFQILNEIYAKYFVINPPARATVQVAALPLGTDVEIDMIAFKGH